MPCRAASPPRAAPARIQEFDANATFACHVKPGASKGEIIAGVNWACASASVKLAGCDATDDEAKLAHASQIFNGYFAEYHTTGATCDFGGAAELTDESSADKKRAVKGKQGAPPMLQLFRGQVPSAGLQGEEGRARAGGLAALVPRLLLVTGVAIGVGLAARSALSGSRRAARARQAEQAAGLREGLVVRAAGHSAG